MVQPATHLRAAPPPVHYSGWAVGAYPEDSAAEMEATVRRMVDNGANVVWIGHNNPGVVDPAKVERGLSYAVYEAFIDPGDPHHAAAAAVIETQHRMLAASRAAGDQAVLPVGYQIQMGHVWNENHPNDLHRDIEAYYRRIEAQFVQPYFDFLLILKLAILAKEGVNAAIVSALDGWDLDGVRTIVALSPSPGHLRSAIWTCSANSWIAAAR